jgi:hypothetical protein
MNLIGKNAYYILLTAYSDKQDDYTNVYQNSQLESALYRKGYEVLKLGHSENKIALLAWKSDKEDQNNNELRMDAIEFIDTYYIESLVIKYQNENDPKRLKDNGQEKNISLVNYNGDMDNSYYTEGVSFSFEEDEEYYIPSKKSDIKVGMIVELKNNKNQWVPREVVDLDKEWDSMYKLLVKYNRIKVIVNKKG